MLRQPIVAVMGHVDHGKTSLLDRIRGTAVAAREAGGITQAIGASIIPLPTIRRVCGPLLERLKTPFTIPGLLFIDTPGHAAFITLRKRGGSIADIAVLVVDINEGFMPQTLECIDILKHAKTPFVIAANKVDLTNGWRSQPGKPLLQSIMEQQEHVQRAFETALYQQVTRLFELGFQADRFDRINDFTKQVAVVPVSAKTGEGIPELLMVLTGLAQRYLEESLKTDAQGPARGTVLEVKEEKGLGQTLDVIIYDGSLEVGDTIIVGGLNGPVQARVKALFLPAPLAEMRERKGGFQSVREVHAATGVKIVAPGAEDAVAGMPVAEASAADLDDIKRQVEQEVKDILIETGTDGIIVKADTLGSLEALSRLLKERGIPIRKASIGPVTKKDLSDAEAMAEKDPLRAAVLGFNLPQPGEGMGRVKVITHDIIYRLIEEYEAWTAEQRKALEGAAVEALARGAKIELLKGYVFRQSNPAVVGIEVLAGILKPNVQLMTRDGKVLTAVKGMQREQENLTRAPKGTQCALSLPNVIIGRHLQEGDILYTAVPEQDYRKLKELKEHLPDDEKEVLKEIAAIMRRHNPVWGV
jgi:translation initiation factor 5B